MSNIIVMPTIPAMTAQALASVQRMESALATRPQVRLLTQHLIHGGMYARTVSIPAGTMIVGVEIKVPTIVIVKGNAMVYIGADVPLAMVGYNVAPASKGRKQAFFAETDVELTMIFPTKATTVEEAEREFTDEYDKLASHRDPLNVTTITGE